MSDPARATPPSLLFATIGVVYFAEGLPYGLVNELFPLYLRLQGVGLGEIGLISLVGLAWTLKLFWAPLVDRYGEYRTWIAISLAAMAIIMAVIAGMGHSRGAVFWTLLSLFALASATQDIAIDAFAIAYSPERLLGLVNSTRVTTYRIAIILAGGGLAVVATTLGWKMALFSAALLLAALIAFALTLPRIKAPAGDHPNAIAGLRRWLNRPGAGALLALVLLYRLGDSAILPMVKPFWVDQGFGAAEIGNVTTTLGISFTIAGAWIGGWVATRHGITNALLWLGICQVGSNIGYALVASTTAGRASFYAVVIIENLAGGLGMAAYLAFLMSICDPRFAATEFALVTALYGLSRNLSGSASGWLATHLGYANFFWLTFLAGVPALVILIRGRVRNSDQ